MSVPKAVTCPSTRELTIVPSTHCNEFHYSHTPTHNTLPHLIPLQTPSQHLIPLQRPSKTKHLERLIRILLIRHTFHLLHRQITRPLLGLLRLSAREVVRGSSLGHDDVHFETVANFDMTFGGGLTGIEKVSIEGEIRTVMETYGECVYDEG